MSHDPIECRDCGESYDPGGSGHDCPGSRRDQSERMDRIEERLRRLEHVVAELTKLLMMPGGPQRDGFREAAQKLIDELGDEQ